MKPRMNGYQDLEQLKADPDQRDIPVLEVSALDKIDRKVKCNQPGASNTGSNCPTSCCRKPGSGRRRPDPDNTCRRAAPGEDAPTRKQPADIVKITK